MIFDAIIQGVMSVVSAFLNLFPTTVFYDVGGAAGAVSVWIVPYLKVADYLGPLHEAVGVLLFIWGLKIVAILVSAVQRIWRLLPILGHGAV